MQFKDDKELKGLDGKHLNEELRKAKAYLEAIAFDHQQGNLKDTSSLKKTRRYIAAMKTYSTQRKQEMKQEEVNK